MNKFFSICNSRLLALLLVLLCSIGVGTAWGQEQPTLNAVTFTTNSYNATTGKYNLTLRSDRYNLPGTPNVVIHYIYYDLNNNPSPEQTQYNDLTADFEPGTIHAWATADGFTPVQDADNPAVWHKDKPFDWSPIWTIDFIATAIVEEGLTVTQGTPFSAEGTDFYNLHSTAANITFNEKFGVEKYYSDATESWLHCSEHGLMHQKESGASFGIQNLRVGEFVAITVSNVANLTLNTSSVLNPLEDISTIKTRYYEVTENGNASFSIPQTDNGSNFYIEKVEVLANNTSIIQNAFVALAKQEIVNSVGYEGTYDHRTSSPLTGEQELRTEITRVEALTNPYRSDLYALDDVRYNFINHNEPKSGYYYTISSVLADAEVTDATKWVNGRTITDPATANGLLYANAPDAIALEIRGETNEYTPVRDRMLVGLNFSEGGTFSKENHTVKKGIYSFDVMARGDNNNNMLSTFYAYVKSPNDTPKNPYDADYYKYTAQQSASGINESWTSFSIPQFIILSGDNVQIGVHAREYQNCHPEDWIQADNFILKYYGTYTEAEPTNWQKGKQTLNTLLNYQITLLNGMLTEHPTQAQNTDNFDSESVSIPKCIKDYISGFNDIYSRYTETNTIYEYIQALDTQEDEGIVLWMNAIGAKQNYAIEHRKLVTYHNEYYERFQHLHFAQEFNEVMNNWKSFDNTLNTQYPDPTLEENLQMSNEWINFFKTHIDVVKAANDTLAVYIQQLNNLNDMWRSAKNDLFNPIYEPLHNNTEYEDLKTILGEYSSDNPDVTETSTFDAFEMLSNNDIEITMDYNIRLKTAYDRFREALEPVTLFNEYENNMAIWLGKNPTTGTDLTDQDGDMWNTYQTYINVNGREREELKETYQKYQNKPTDIAGYDAASAEQKAVVGRFIAAQATYNELAAEINYCDNNINSSITTKLLSDYQLTYTQFVTETNTTTKSSEIEQILYRLKNDESNFITDNYPSSYNAGIADRNSLMNYFQPLFDTQSKWEYDQSTKVSGQHWSDQSSEQYLEKHSISNSTVIASLDIKEVAPWTLEGLTETVNIPTLAQGDYAFVAACRASENVKGSFEITITDNSNNTVVHRIATPLVHKGNTGLGIAKNKYPGYDTKANDFANNDKGYGWEYKILTFSVPDNAKAVKIELKAELADGADPNVDNWISFSDVDLASKTINNTSQLARLMLWMEQYTLYRHIRDSIEYYLGNEYYYTNNPGGADWTIPYYGDGITQNFEEFINTQDWVNAPPHTQDKTHKLGLCENGFPLGSHFLENVYSVYKDLKYTLYLCDGTVPTKPEGWPATRNAPSFSTQEIMIEYMKTHDGLSDEEAKAKMCNLMQNAINTFKKYDGQLFQYFPIAIWPNQTYIMSNTMNDMLANTSDDGHCVLQNIPASLWLEQVALIDIHHPIYTLIPVYRFKGHNGYYIAVDDQYHITTTTDPMNAAVFLPKVYDYKDAGGNIDLTKSYYQPILFMKRVSDNGYEDLEHPHYVSAQGNYEGAFLTLTTEEPPTFTAPAEVKDLGIWVVQNYAVRKVNDIIYIAGTIDEDIFKNALTYVDINDNNEVKDLPYAEVDIRNVNNDWSDKKGLLLDETGKQRNIILYTNPGQVGQQHNVVEISTNGDGQTTYYSWCIEIVDQPENDHDYLIKFSYPIFSPEIIYRRPVLKQQNWLTMMLPYTVISYDSLQYYQFYKYEDVSGTPAKPDSFGKKTDTGSRGTLFFEKVEMLPARRPGAGRRIPILGEEEYDYFDIGEWNAAVTTDLNDTERSNEDWTVVGCMKGQIVHPGANEEIYAFWNDKQSGQYDKFKKASTIHVAPFRCYFKHNTTSSGAAPDILDIDAWDDQPSNIEELTENGTRKSDNVVFFGKGEIIVEAGRECDLRIYKVDGSLVAEKHVSAGSTTTFNLPSGIYIIDGVKITI